MKSKRSWLSADAGILALVMVITMLAGIGPADAATSDELKNQLDDLQERKDQIAQQIQDLESQQSENLSSIQQILEQKYILDQQIALLYAQVDNVNQQIAAYDRMIADKQADLEAAQARLAELNEKNKERIRAMEEEGELSYWSVLFQASDFSDLLDRLNMIQEIAAVDWAAGNYVKIDHQDGYSSIYMHMTHYVVARGEYVKAGQLIGYVGNTGLSKGAHLHFGISYKGQYVNPMDHLG